jgi:hypothetical protein
MYRIRIGRDGPEPAIADGGTATTSHSLFMFNPDSRTILSEVCRRVEQPGMHRILANRATVTGLVASA